MEQEPEAEVLRAELAALRTDVEQAAARAVDAARAAEQTAVELKKSKQDKRPHWWTILFNFMTLTFTVTAIVFTYRTYINGLESLSLTNQALHVGQRAYLTVRQGRLTVRPQISYWGPNSRDEPTEVVVPLPNRQYADWRHVRLTYGFDLINAGNSPAIIKQMTFTLRTPSGWTVSTAATPDKILGNLRTVRVMGRETLMAAPEGEEIGPRTTSVLKFAPVFNLTEIAARTIQYGASVSSLVMKGGEAITVNSDETRVTGDVVYSDVFGVLHSLHWCWAYNEDYLHTSEIPLACVEPTGVTASRGTEETSNPKKR